MTANKTVILTAASQSVGEVCARLVSKGHNFLSGFLDCSPVRKYIRLNISFEIEMTVYELVREFLFLFSDDAKYITSQNLIIDGSMVIIK